MDLSGLTDVIGLVFIVLFTLLIVAFIIVNRRWPVLQVREIPAFTRLARAIGLAVEDGSRLHFSIGSGDITGPESAAAYVGLSMLRQIATITSESDTPPIASAGDGALAILTQDTLRAAYRDLGAEDQFEPGRAQLTGLSPFSYAAGAMSLVFDETVSSNLFAGSFNNEVALLTDASERRSSFSIAGTDNLTGQAVLYATAQEPLIGEELYAGGAYLQVSAAHTASLHAQDVLRIAIGVAILIGSLAKLFGILS